MKGGSIVHGIGTVLVVGAAALWYLTGSEGYTRWPNAHLEQADAPPPAGQDDLLAQAGFDTAGDAKSPPTIESRFAFGLLPGGLDLKHLPSVASAAGVSLFMSGVVMIRSARARSRSKRGVSNSGGIK